MHPLRLLVAFVLILLSTASGIASATNYTLWINGRANGAGVAGNYNSFGYWGSASASAGVNKKSVNWDGYNSIASQNSKVRDALDCFCTGSNWCAELDRADNEGKTALTFAAMFGHPDTVRFMLDAGASARQRGRWGTTALH
jgi:hypothetical protein